MKILHTVEFYSPSVGGSQEVVRQLSEHLVLLGHDVTVATTMMPNRHSKIVNGVKIVEFDVSGNAVVGYSGRDIKKYQQFLLKNKFDVMMNYAAQQWATDLALDIISQIKSKKVFCPCGFSGLKHEAFKDYYAQLSKTIKFYDSLVCTSSQYQDYKYCKKYSPVRVSLINNGASEVEFFTQYKPANFLSDLGINKDSRLLLNVSSHVFSKNHADLITIFKRIKARNTTLILVANSFSKLECSTNCHRQATLFNLNPLRLIDGKKIINIQLSREATIAAYNYATAFVFPSLIECSPLVLYESLAAGLPFVAYPSGNSREIVEKSGGGIIMKSIDQGVKALNKLLSSPKMVANLSKNGRKYWESHARWDKITTRYEKLYRTIQQET